MTTRPFVTALIDTYNHERFIAEAIQSVMDQDFPRSDMEILVVDDGSTDRTGEIVHRFEPRIRVLRKANGGQASAFNAGIPEARGEVVAFLDGDDWWAPGKLASVVEAFALYGSVGVVGHGITVVRPDGRRYTESPREFCRFCIRSNKEARMFHTRRGFLGTSRVAYRKEILERIGPVPRPLKFEADEYMSAAAGFFCDIAVLPSALTFYRLHSDNLFQLGNARPESARAKQQVLAFLATAVSAKLTEINVRKDLKKIIVGCIQAEADILKLSLDSGYPWQTVSAEWVVHRALYSDASLAQHLFTLARLIPALAMPAATYYKYRGKLANSAFYQRVRRQALPLPVPRHVMRRDGSQ